MSIGRQTSAPKSVLQADLDTAHKTKSDPPIVGDRIAYGVVTEVNDQNQVRVTLYGKKDSLGNAKEILGGKFIQVATQLSTVQLLYGQLRKGMKVQVHWRGQNKITWALAHIIGDEENPLGEAVGQEPLNVEIATPPMAILGGGKEDL